jgi:hypothetical protein
VKTHDDDPGDSQAAAAAHALTALQEEFPHFTIWRENMHGRPRYVARSQHLNLNPHTVITDDPDELRAALSRPS